MTIEIKVEITLHSIITVGNQVRGWEKGTILVCGVDQNILFTISNDQHEDNWAEHTNALLAA